MSLIGLLILLLVFCLIVWAARQLMGAFGIGQPIATVVRVVILLIFVLWLIEALGLLPGGPIIRLR